MTDDAQLRGQETGEGGQTTDTELLRRYAGEKSDEAFGELVRRHIDFVYAAALRQARGNAPLAQDVTQSVFTDLARKSSQLARHKVVVGWLHTATRFAVAKAIRSESRRIAREQEAFAMNEARHESGAPIDWERLHPVLDAVLGELKERERAAILLRFFEKLPLAEVGAKLALTESAARSCVDRALEKMHGLLARRGVTSTAVALGVALANQVGVAAPAGLAASVTGAVLAGASGGGAVPAILTSMSTSKTAVAIIGIFAALGIATATYEIREVRKRDSMLQLAAQQQDELRAKVIGLEGRLAAESKRGQEAEADNAELLKVAGGILANGAAKNSVRSIGVLTHQAVQARYSHAHELVRMGDFAGALKEFLWCFDDGMARVSTFRVARRAALLDAMAKLGEQYPEALEAMRVRRDQAEKNMLAGNFETDAVADFVALNRALNEIGRTMEQYDRLAPNAPGRQDMAMLAYEQFLPTQRYADAALAKPYARMDSEFAALTRGRPIAADNPNAEEIRRDTRDFAVKTAANSIEVLAGAGDLAHARTLAEKLLAYDNSEQTKAILQTRLVRAGHAELLSLPLKN